MKKMLLSLGIALLGTLTCPAQSTIRLPVPEKNAKAPLMKALNDRRSVREYDTSKPLPLQQLSNLLWAANGVNRSDGKRTAPSAINAQDVDIYVCRADGAYRYNAAKHNLERVSTKDLRGAVADRQDFAKQAPVSLVLVSDAAKFSRGGGDKWGGVDAGYVSQNICLYCAAFGLATVPRGTMNTATLKKDLQLTDTQTLWLNHPVGYAK